jgi:acyl-CoA synthetase (AMP-forming)/AMP-acid ligase II/thioesterase domain-containing protein/acyl carrier protein
MNKKKFSTFLNLLSWYRDKHFAKQAYFFLEDGERIGESWTYGDLEVRVQAIAACLQSLTGGSSERALLLFPQKLSVISAFLGCLYANVVAIPVPPPEPGHLKRSLPRLQAIAKDAQVSLVLSTSRIISLLKDSIQEFPELKQATWVDIDSIDLGLALQWKEMPIQEDALAYLQYTSGSTSTPKGVMLTHQNILHHLSIIHQDCGYSDRSVTVNWLPYFHDYGLVAGLLLPLYAGIPCYLMSPFSFIRKPLRWLQAITQYCGTHSQGPNFAYDLCLRQIQSDQLEALNLESWELAGCGGEPINPKIMEQFYKKFAACGFQWTAFAPAYGLAEYTLMISTTPKQSPPVFTTVDSHVLERDNHVVEVPAYWEGGRTYPSCGRLTGDSKVLIVNPILLTECPDGDVGEIWVQGLSTAQGYWQRAEATEDTFKASLPTHSGSFLRTGDLGFLKEGELYVTGRIKDLIIIAGANHYPQDIEWTVQHCHPSLRPNGGAAFSVEVSGQECLFIAQEVEGNYLKDSLNASYTDSLIQAICQAVFENHGLQVYGILLLRPGTVPKTSSGKIQRSACRRSFLEGKLEFVTRWSVENQTLQIISEDIKPAATQRVQPQTLEEQLLLIWREVFSSESIGLQDNFFMLGGNSLRAAQILATIERDLKRTLSVSDLTRAATIANLAQIIRGESLETNTLHELVEVIQPQGSRIPLFMITPISIPYGFVYTSLAQCLGSNQPFYAIKAISESDRKASSVSIEEKARICIEAMRSIQPKGPYYIGGYCAGAFIAHEMAVLLSLEKELVSNLIILDTGPSSAYDLHHSFFLKKLLRGLSLGLGVLEKIYYLTEASLQTKHGSLAPSLWQKIGYKFLALSQTLQRAESISVARNIQPNTFSKHSIKTFDGDLYLFRTKGTTLRHLTSYTVEDDGWGKFVSGRVVTSYIPGNHLNFLDPPHVTMLAAKVKELLETLTPLTPDQEELMQLKSS